MKDEAAERIIRSLIKGGFDIDKFKKSLEDAGRKYKDVYEDDEPSCSESETNDKKKTN